jgi:outer membrane protein assembly factor BamB
LHQRRQFDGDGSFRVKFATNKLAVLAAMVLVASPVRAGDWPQILGPNRDGKAAADETLLDAWPAGGPKVLWTHKLGAGYAGVAVAAGKTIAFHRVDDQERIEAFDAASGKSLWKADFDATYRGGIDADKGPRCVPLIAEGRVYVFGAAGDLHAVSLADGKKLWSRSLYDDYGGDEGYFGAGSSPILVGGKLIVNVGGRGAGLVALDPATGRTAWKGTDEAASYSSPTAVKLGNAERVLFITRLNCVLVDPATGKAQTLAPFGQRGPTVNAATPLVFGGKMFLTSSYGVGALFSSLDAQGSQEVWANDETLSSQYATPVEQAGFLYGIHGREDVGEAELRCVEAATGKVRWSQPRYGVAHVILADAKLLIQTVEGRIALAAADPAKYRELAAFQLTREPTRAIPAFAAGRLYVRTGSTGGELICVQVGK